MTYALHGWVSPETGRLARWYWLASDGAAGHASSEAEAQRAAREYCALVRDG